MQYRNDTVTIKRNLKKSSRPLFFILMIMACGLSGYQAVAIDDVYPSYSFNGFATLGAVYSDEDQADFVSSWLLQPNGAGHTSDWHAGVDTKLGGQLDIQFNPAFSAVLQVVVQRQEDNAWTPEIEWANIKYQFNDNLSLRLGRTVLQTFMVSDTRLVGYANPWIRGPQEVYQLNPLTNFDGLDLTYSQEFDSGRNIMQLNIGQSNRDIIRDGQIRARNGLVLINTFEVDFATLRLMYMRAKLDLSIEQSDLAFDAYATLGEALSLIPGQEANAAQARAISTRYLVEDAPTELYSVGIKLEPGNWLLMGEWGRVTETGALASVTAGYTTLAYHFAELMPFLTLAEVNGDTPNEPGLSTTGMPPPLATEVNQLNQGLNTLLSQASAAQKSITAGIRWDFHPGAALKLQYQHIDIDKQSPGRLGNVQPGFSPGGTVNVFSTAIDLVF